MCPNINEDNIASVVRRKKCTTNNWWRRCGIDLPHRLMAMAFAGHSLAMTIRRKTKTNNRGLVVFGVVLVLARICSLTIVKDK